MILIITGKQDGHIGSVAEHLRDEWIRLNTEDIANNVILSLGPDRAKSFFHIKDSNKSFSLNDVRSVWYRKPEPTHLDHLQLNDATLDYVEAEFNEILLGIYALLHGRLWINDPFKSRI